MPKFPSFFAFWLIALIFGIVIGYQTLSRFRFSIDSNTRLINLPGSLFPLILSLSFFLIKYGLGVIYALTPSMRSNLTLLIFDMTASGLISGVFLGRFINIAQAYKSKFYR